MSWDCLLFCSLFIAVSLVGLRCMVVVFPDHTFIFLNYMYVIKQQHTGRYVIVSYRDLLKIMCREKELVFPGDFY